MSGLIAVLPLQDRRAPWAQVAQSLMDGIAHRGPDGVALHGDDGIWLGHAWLNSTGDPAGPWQLSGGGPLVTGDLCLSNAAQLCPPGQVVCDGVAVLAAYARWGLDLLHHLEGAFAFVLWDPAQRRLLAARDRFGIKPLYLRHLPDAIMLCSEPQPLAQAWGPLPSANAEWIADFLAGYDTSDHMTADTGIEKLPPGHLLLAERGQTVTRRWWSLHDQPALHNPDANFADLLGAACKDGVRGGRTGAMLSGGLDSSAVSLLAQRHSPGPLTTLSLRYAPQSGLDEGPFIDAVRQAGRFDAVDIEADADVILGQLETVLAEQQHPFAGLGLGATRLLYRRAASVGLKAVLDGHGGDEVVCQGFDHLDELAAQGRVLALARISRQLGQFVQSPWMPFALGPLAQSGPRPWGGIARRVLCRMGPVASQPHWRGLVSPDLAAQTNLVARVQAAEAAKSDARLGGSRARAQHLDLACGPGTATAFEVLDRAAARAGIEPRYPFYDRRLLEWCIAQPSGAKLARGRPRALLRDGMAGILPEAIRLRPDKTNFLPNIWLGLVNDPSGQVLRFANAPPDRLSPYVNMDALREAAQTLLNARTPGEIQPILWLWRAIWLDLWLAERERRRAAPPRHASACHPCPPSAPPTRRKPVMTSHSTLTPLLTYQAYGMQIASEIPLPELSPCLDDGAGPQMTIRYGAVAVPGAADGHAAWFAFTPETTLMHWPDVATFSIADGGRQVTVRPRPGVGADLLAFPLLGPVLSDCLRRIGYFVLHASAVTIDGQALALLADKGTGKSTTASALLEQGAALLADDLVAVKTASMSVAAGFGQIKLSQSALDRLSLQNVQKRPHVHDAIDKIRVMVPANFHPAPAPLRRCYILGRDAALTHTRIDPVPQAEALPEILRYAYAARFGRDGLNGAAAAGHFRDAVALSQSGTLRRLTVPHDLARMDQIVAAIRADMSVDVPAP